ncbi:hypothetical protein ACJ2PR_28350 [Phormidesmis sp. 146-33]
MPLIRGSSGAIVTGLLVTLTEKHLDDYETFWKSRLQQVEAADKFFDWEWKQRVLVPSGEAEGYAIEQEQMTQGLMMLRTRGKRSFFDQNRRIVYVSRLATAPWNRADLQTPIEFRAVGGTLMRFAQLRSEELGYGGLVGVHSLPEAEAFYRKLNMADCDLDENYENLRYFEWYRPRPSVMDELDL